MMADSGTDDLRHHLVNLLTARQAHATFDDVVDGLPPDLRGRRPDGLPYSVWEQVEHMRIAQRDILDYCRDPEYTQPAWPDEYWPEAAAPADETAWERAVGGFREDLAAFSDLVRDASIDLHATVPNGDGHTYLREAMLVADHNAYHIGQIVVIRRQIGAWPDSG
jgi:uncharacterized damage-inducible protein DinB